MQLFLLLLFVPILASMAGAHAASIELDSTQARALKDAEWYLNEFDRAFKPIAEKANAVSQGQSQLDEIGLQKALNEVNHAGLKLNNALQRLAQLPGEEPSVKAVSQRAADSATQLLACQGVFEQAQSKKADQIANVGDIEADVKRLEALSREIANGEFIYSVPDRSLETIRGLDRMIEFRNEMQKQYQAVLNEHVGYNMKTTLEGFDYRLNQYREEMERAKGRLPKQIRSDFEQAQTICDTSVERRRAQTFTDGIIEATFQRAQVNLDLLEAIGGSTAETQALAAEKKSAETKIASAAKALQSEILNANTPPNDVYGGGDKAEILQLVEAAWKKSPVKSEVLAMRVPMRAWERSEGIRWAHDRYELHDFSEIQVAISVKGDANTVHNYYAYLEKDHLKGDKIRVRIDDKGEVPLYRKVLIENWK